MAYKLRKLRKDNNASGFGTLLILFPFIISVLLTAVFIPMENKLDIGINDLNFDIPIGYKNMSVQDRKDYLVAVHGGNYTPHWVYELTWTFKIIPFIGQTYYLFPDLFDISKNNYNTFVDGNALDIDYLAIAENILTINPPALEKLGLYGTAFRIILIICVAIGLTEILWIG